MTLFYRGKTVSLFTACKRVLSKKLGRIDNKNPSCAERDSMKSLSLIYHLDLEIHRKALFRAKELHKDG